MVNIMVSTDKRLNIIFHCWNMATAQYIAPFNVQYTTLAKWMGSESDNQNFPPLQHG